MRRRGAGEPSAQWASPNTSRPRDAITACMELACWGVRYLNDEDVRPREGDTASLEKTGRRLNVAGAGRERCSDDADGGDRELPCLIQMSPGQRGPSALVRPLAPKP